MYILLKQQLCLEFKSWFVKIGLLVLLLFPGEYSSSERLISLPSQAECNWNLWVVIKLRRMGWTQVCQKWISRQFWRNPNKWFHFIFLLSFFGVLEICRLLSFIWLLWCCLSNRIGIPRLTYLHFFAIHLGQVLQQNLAIFLFFA